MTGGVGEKGDFNESVYMLNFLKENGVDKTIYIDDKSINTEENVINSIGILKELDLLDKPVVLLSNEFHLRKISMQMKKMIPNLDLIYEFPHVSSFSYSSIVQNSNLRPIAVNQVIKFKRFIQDGLMIDQDIDAFSMEERYTQTENKF